MRILYVNPVGSGALDGYFEEHLAGAAGSDVAIDVCHLELDEAASSPFLPALPFYHGALFERLKQGEEEGYDGLVIGCSGDPGLIEARRMLRVPVTGPLEAALHLGALMHQRIAILIADGFEAHLLYEDLARYYGLSHVVSEQLIVPMDYPDPKRLARLMRDDPDEASRLVLERHCEVLVTTALELASGAVARGAGVVYAGCTLWTGAMLQPFRAALGVPVIDPGQAAVLAVAAAARARAGTPLLSEAPTA